MSKFVRRFRRKWALCFRGKWRDRWIRCSICKRVSPRWTLRPPVLDPMLRACGHMIWECWAHSSGGKPPPYRVVVPLIGGAYLKKVD